MITQKTRAATVSPPHYHQLDALRGIAILSVVIFHAYIIRPFFHGPWWMDFVGQGAEGVGLFYMVSALTLALSWKHRSEVDREPRKAFWLRRFMRIAPLFYLTLLAAFLLHAGNPTVVPPSMKHHIFTWANLLTHVTFVFGWLPWFQNSWIGVEWSIGVEMTFYFLFPWLMEKVFPRVDSRILLATGLVLALGWPWLLHHLWFPWPRWAKSFLLWSFPVQWIWFAAGFLVVACRARPTKTGWATLWLLAALFLGGRQWTAHAANLLWVAPNVLLVWLTWHNYRGIRWLIQNRWLQYIGTRSYSIYLVHWLVLAQIARLAFASTPTTSGWLLRLLLGLAVSLAISEITFRIVEQPGIALGRLLIDRLGWGRRPVVQKEMRNESWGPSAPRARASRS